MDVDEKFNFLKLDDLNIRNEEGSYNIYIYAISKFHIKHVYNKK